MINMFKQLPASYLLHPFPNCFSSFDLKFPSLVPYMGVNKLSFTFWTPLTASLQSRFSPHNVALSKSWVVANQPGALLVEMAVTQPLHHESLSTQQNSPNWSTNTVTNPTHSKMSAVLTFLSSRVAKAQVHFWVHCCKTPPTQDH